MTFPQSMLTETDVITANHMRARTHTHVLSYVRILMTKDLREHKTNLSTT